MRWLPRVLRALLLALVILVAGDLVLATRVPPADPTPMPWRNSRGWAFGWNGDVGGGVHLTWGGQVAARERPQGRLRVAVFGSSAVAGDGTSRFHAFPWRLQRRLERRGVDAEVLNLGISGQDSVHHRAALERTLTELAPTAAVVYMGNNEFHRLRLYQVLNPAWTAEGERLRLLLERLALYRWLAARAPRTEPLRGEEYPQLHEIPGTVGEADRRLALGMYRANLEGMTAACRSAGVPLLLCTVAANDEYRPNYSRPEGGGVAGQHYDAGMAARSSGDLETARRELTLARELDPAPNRILPSFNEAVREVAARSGTLLCDVDARMRVDAPGGLLGHETFVDNCHFTRTGHERAAGLIEEALQGAGLVPAGAAPLTADAGGIEDLPLGEGKPIPPEYEAMLEVLRGIENPRALEVLRAAAEGDPRRRELWRDLGRTALAMARIPQAREAYARFVAEGGRDPSVARELELLERSR